MIGDENVNTWHQYLDGLMKGEPESATFEEPDPEEKLRKISDMEYPVMITYAILPAPPAQTGAMLSPNQQPVYLDYSNLNWKALADAFQRELEKLGTPKSIKAYVATDALDIWDVSHVKPGTNVEVDDYQPVYEAYQCFQAMSFENFRGGLIKFPKTANFHVEPPEDGPRTPVCGVFVSFRFDRFMQTLDYLEGITYSLLNVPDSLAMQPGVYRDVPISRLVKDWMLDHCGVVAGDEMEIFRMPPIYRGEPKSRKQG